MVRLEFNIIIHSHSSSIYIAILLYADPPGLIQGRSWHGEPKLIGDTTLTPRAHDSIIEGAVGTGSRSRPHICC